MSGNDKSEYVPTVGATLGVAGYEGTTVRREEDMATSSEIRTWIVQCENYVWRTRVGAEVPISKSSPPVTVIELEPILDLLEGWRDPVDKRKQLTKPVEEATDALLARYRPNREDGR